MSVSRGTVPSVLRYVVSVAAEAGAAQEIHRAWKKSAKYKSVFIFKQIQRTK